MPYIKQERRRDITDYPSQNSVIVKTRNIDSAGELNFAITSVIADYIAGHGERSYAIINEVIGVLECAKLELYRRIASPYEDEKIKENGDVY